MVSDMKQPRFSAQISGSPAPRGTKNSDIMINTNSSNSSGQISSPRKRRKGEAKKVVCIAAPACANNRPTTGEIVPSDLWAWRKYGQKPIKGSPYPRGYYRCSSWKGCPARKQVERSRTDPNMLVITYTSEHNHPWPTQRNALAGSTRSHPSNNKASLKMDVTPVKEEVQEQLHLQVEESPLTHHGFPHMSEQDSFFVDLDELDTEPLHLLFTQGFGGDNINDDDHSSESRDQSKGLEEQFSLFDWSEHNHKGL